MTIIDYLYSHPLNPDTLLLGYNNGFFPMGNPDSGEIDWHCPAERAIIPLQDVRISRSLRQTLKKGHFEFSAAQNHSYLMMALDTIGCDGS